MSTRARPRAETLAAADAAELRAAIRGVVLTSVDRGYDDARQLFNAAIDRRPAALVQVSGGSDVSAALDYARTHRLSVSVRGGGRGIAGHALGGDVVIDLSALRGVVVDPQERTAVVRAGSTWSDVDTACQGYGLALPGGRISHTGVAGLTLGGGEGWLSTLHGPSCSSLLGAGIVTADGRRLTVSEQSDPELFLALRGGGGTFGVVTSFTFRLHEVGPLVLGGQLLYRLADAGDVLATLDELRARHDAFATAAAFLTAPPAPFVPGDLVARPVLAVVPAWFGDLDDGTRVLSPLRTRLRPLVDAAGPMPYATLQSMLDVRFPDGFRQRWATSVLPTLTTGAISEFEDAAAARLSPASQIVLLPIGRDAGWRVQSIAQWTDSAADAAHLTWTDGLHQQVGRHGGVRARPVVGADRLDRLRRAKTTWDPHDVFRHCHHIEPATARV